MKITAMRILKYGGYNIYTYQNPVFGDRQFDDQMFHVLGDGSESGNRCSRDEDFHDRYLKHSNPLCHQTLALIAGPKCHASSRVATNPSQYALWEVTATELPRYRNQITIGPRVDYP